jgi:hypothetical protein
MNLPTSTYYAVLLALVLGVGCGKVEPELSTEKVITSDEAANKLFVEANKLIGQAQAKKEAGRWGVETEHPNVLLCGSAARRGGAVSGIPGHNAAMKVLEQITKTC